MPAPTFIALGLLLAAPAAAKDWHWPAPSETWADVEPARHLANDIDGGGTVDELFEFHVRGSGFRQWLVCAWHGETQDRACVEFRATSYSHFRGYRVYSASANGAAAGLLRSEIPTCRGADREDPHQGAMWMLHRPTAGAKKLKWYRGRLKRQSPTCLSVDAAADFVGGHAWHAKGGPKVDSPAWSVIYEPSWTATKFKREPLEKRAADKRFRLFSHRHAMAVFDKEKVRHAWLVNFEGHVDDSFKLDRWQTIASVDQENRDLFNVRVKLGPSEKRTLVLNVVRLLYGRAPRIALRAD